MAKMRPWDLKWANQRATQNLTCKSGHHRSITNEGHATDIVYQYVSSETSTEVEIYSKSILDKVEQQV